MKFLTPEEVAAKRQLNKKLLIAGMGIGVSLLSILVTYLVNWAL